MNNYFTVRIALNDLEKKNDKLEYRALYKEMKQEGFTESYFDADERELQLPNGMYAIVKFDFTLNDIMQKAEVALEAALKPYYKGGWANKYTLIVCGPSEILSRNLESAN